MQPTELSKDQALGRLRALSKSWPSLSFRMGGATRAPGEGWSSKGRAAPKKATASGPRLRHVVRQSPRLVSGLPWGCSVAIRSVAGLGISLGENALHPELREQRYRSLAMCHSSICSLSAAQSLAQEKVQASLKRTHGKFFRKDQRLSTADHSLVGVNRLTAKSDLSKGSERERLEPALTMDPR